MALKAMPKGEPSVALPLCLNCAEYIRETDTACPHCGQDPTEPGGRYKDDGFYARDALEHLLDVMERAVAAPKDNEPHPQPKE